MQLTRLCHFRSASFTSGQVCSHTSGCKNSAPIKLPRRMESIWCCKNSLMDIMAPRNLHMNLRMNLNKEWGPAGLFTLLEAAKEDNMIFKKVLKLHQLVFSILRIHLFLKTQFAAKAEQIWVGQGRLPLQGGIAKCFCFHRSIVSFWLWIPRSTLHYAQLCWALR